MRITDNLQIKKNIAADRNIAQFMVQFCRIEFGPLDTVKEKQFIQLTC